MKITVDVATLAGECRRLSKVTAEKGALPVLSNILVHADDALSLAATDLQVGLVLSCPAQIIEPGETTLPAKKLLEILEQLPPGTMTIAESAGRVNVTAGSFRSRLQAIDATEFPEIPHPDGDVVKLPAADLRAVIERTSYAISDRQASYILKGALLSIHEGMFALVATDGKRLSIATAACGTGSGVQSAVVPAKTLDVLAGHCEGREVEFSTDGRHLFFVAGTRTLYSQMVDGKFPSYERIIPRDTTMHATIDRLALTAALRRVGIVADTDQAVSLTFTPGWLTMAARSTTFGDADEQLPADYAGDELTFAINGRHVLDFLDHASQPSVTLDTRPGAPLLFTDGPDFINVVLGMKS